MTGKTHLSVGIASTVMVSSNIGSIVSFLPFIILGSLIPDIDSHSSIIRSRNVMIISWISIITLLYLSNDNIVSAGIITTTILSIIYSNAKHRSIAHSFFGMFLLMISVSLISFTGMLWFTLGYVIHLILDSLTVKGVPLLYPFEKKRFGFKVCSAKGATDKLLRIASIYIAIFIGLYGFLTYNVR